MALSFPRFGHPLLAWVALIPFFHALARCARIPGPFPARRFFGLGLLVGAVYFAGTVYWTADVMAVYGGLPVWQAAPIAGLLVAYLAVYPALFALVAGWLLRQLGPRMLLVLPAAWVATEYARGTLFSGFPWVLLGYSQVSVLPVAQLASVTGVFGVSLLVALVNAAGAYALVRRTGRVAAVATAVALTGIVAGWGGWRMRHGTLTSEGQPLSVGIVQGNVPQDQKWDPERGREIFERYLGLTRRAASRGAQLIVWPESSTPFLYEEDALGRTMLLQTLADIRVPVLLGSDQIERGSTPRIYNAAFLVMPDGEVADVYRKTHLVPFGEYVPLKDVLFFAKPLVEAVGEFSQGDDLRPLRLGHHAVSTAICYEIVFPSLVRESVALGSQLLTTLTNDAWYGWSSAPYQHFEQASMRAIENGRYLVRAANTGFSGIVDPYGRVRQRSRLFETSTLVGEVRLLSSATIYGRMGDTVAYASMLLTGLLLATAWRR